MNQQEIEEWHKANGIEYIEEDWGPRADTGESDGAQASEGLRFPDAQPRLREAGGNRPTVLPLLFPDGESSSWEHPDFRWPPERTAEELVLHEKLEEFFTPYIAMLPHIKGERIRMLMNDQLTYEEIADAEGRSNRGSVFNSVNRALQDLVRLIAEDDPEFVATKPRDYEAETAAAERMFDHYMEEVIE